MNILKLYNGSKYVLSDVVNGKLIERSIMFDKWHNKRNTTIKKEIKLFKQHIKNLNNK
mgnify:CR=1 FL=1